MDDMEILELYFARDEQAIVQTGKKYGSYCYLIADQILKCREDSEETVNDTYLQTWNSIPPQRPDFLRLFLGKITRNLAFSRWRKYSAEKRGRGETVLVLEELAECIPGNESIDDRLNGKVLASCISRFLATQPERTRHIFLLRYFSLYTSEEIAKCYGLQRTNVNMILSRTRMKLKIYLTEEGYGL